jgi:hypothetical protein
MSSQATGYVNIKTATIQSVGLSLSALTVNTVSRPRSKMYIRKLTTIAILAVTAAAHLVVPNDDQDMSDLVVNGIPYSTRVKYMRLVLTPSHPFPSIVPNHPSGQRSPIRAKRTLSLRRIRHHHCEPHQRLGRLPRRKLPHWRSNVQSLQFPLELPKLIALHSIHGEISAINACTAVFVARNMTPTEIFAAWADLSICNLSHPIFPNLC